MANPPVPLKSIETELEKYWRLRIQYVAFKSVIDQIASLSNTSRMRKTTAQAMLNTSHHLLQIRKYTDYQRNVIVISVAMVVAACAAFACPPLTAVIANRLGYTVSGRMGQKIALNLAIATFAVSATSQYTASYLLTGKGLGVSGVGYEILFKDSIKDYLARIPEPVALMTCIKLGSLSNTIDNVNKKANELAEQITKSPEERTVIARTIIHKFWDDMLSKCAEATYKLGRDYIALEKEFKALEVKLSKQGPIGPAPKRPV